MENWQLSRGLSQKLRGSNNSPTKPHLWHPWGPHLVGLLAGKLVQPLAPCKARRVTWCSPSLILPHLLFGNLRRGTGLILIPLLSMGNRVAKNEMSGSGVQRSIHLMVDGHPKKHKTAFIWVQVGGVGQGWLHISLLNSCGR